MLLLESLTIDLDLVPGISPKEVVISHESAYLLIIQDLIENGLLLDSLLCLYRSMHLHHLL